MEKARTKGILSDRPSSNRNSVIRFGGSKIGKRGKECAPVSDHEIRSSPKSSIENANIYGGGLHSDAYKLWLHFFDVFYGVSSSFMC